MGENRFMGVEITGKVLGVIGCGNIGSLVADRAIGLHMHVIAYDPFLTPERALDLGVEKVELDALLARADIITLHAPMTLNCTRDEGGPFEFGNQVLISSHRKLPRSRAVVVSVAETPGR